MTHVHTLSPTRCVSYKAMGRNIKKFSGSSAIRTNPKKLEGEGIEALTEDNCKQNDALTGVEKDNIQDIYQDAQQTAKPEKDLRSMSQRTRRKIKDKALNFIYAQGRTDFYFMTLTFVNRCEDYKAVKVLNRFLTTLREDCGTFAYIWVAERQNKNKEYAGNIHFHVILDLRIDIQRFNALWVLQQYNAGIINPKVSYEQMYAAYQAKTVQKLLNPLDVKHARNIDKIAAYLTTYVTKNKDEFTCRTWGCSRHISRLCTHMQVDEEIANETENERINYAINHRTKKRYVVKPFETEHARIRTIYNKEYFKEKLLPLTVLNAFLLYMKHDLMPPDFPHDLFDLTNQKN